jgi:hypothetical protein
MRSVEVHMEIEREWRKIFRIFSNLKAPRVDNEFVDGLSVELLRAELQVLAYSQAGSGNARADVFISFIDTRQNIGRSVTLIHL